MKLREGLNKWQRRCIAALRRAHARACPSVMPCSLRASRRALHPSRSVIQTLLGRVICCASLLAALQGCAVQPNQPDLPSRALAADDNPTRTALAFHAASQKPGGPQAPARPQTPLQQMQLALQLGGPNNADLPRAIALLDSVLRSDAPQAQQLHPLARLLHEQYNARQRADAAAERASATARDAQRRADGLQDKLDALAEIERSLPTRPARPGTRKETAR